MDVTDAGLSGGLGAVVRAWRRGVIGGGVGESEEDRVLDYIGVQGI